MSAKEAKSKKSDGGAVAHDHDHDHEHHDHDHEHDHDHSHEEEEFQFEEDPVYTVEYKGECLYNVGVTLAPSNTKKQSAEALDELRKTAQVPGFRKGKAPVQLLEGKYGKVVRGEVVERLVRACFVKLLKDQDLKPLALPDIEGLEDLSVVKEDEPLAFTLKFEVHPKCELGRYRGIDVERPVVTVEDKDVEEAIENMRGRFSTFEDSTEAAQEGDQVIIDFEGKIDGEAFQGGSATNYPYILGSGRFFKEFEEALAGAKAGEERSAIVNFPADYSAAELAGKAADFTIKLNEVKRKQLPALDDEFAKQAGYETLAAMQDKVRRDLDEGSQEQSRKLAEANALEKIVADSTFEIPKSLIESTARTYEQQEVRRLMSMRVPASVVEEQLEQITTQANEDALRNIKSFIVVNEIGEAEGIEVTDEDFEREANTIAQRTGAEMDVVSRYLQTEERSDEYRQRIFRQKALDVVMSNATITDKELPADEPEGSNG